MKRLVIREVTADDRDTWLALYRAVFGPGRDAGLLREIDRIYAEPAATAYIAWLGAQPVGFAEYALRPHANGCESKPVPFLEGIWVDPSHRHGGIGAALVAHLESVARAGGHREIGSDVELSNRASQEAHARWGFEETERVVHFRKLL